MDSIIAGLVLGGLYALPAQALVLTFIATRTLNFATGELIAVGALAGLAMSQVTALPTVLRLAATLVLVSVLGIVIYLLLIVPFAGRGEHDIRWLLSTVGLSFVLLDLLTHVEGATPQRTSLLALSGQATVLGVGVNVQSLFIVALSVGTTIALVLVTRFTRLGLAMRAIAQDRGTTSLMGVSPTWVGVAVYGLATAIVGLTGIVWAAEVGASPNMGAGLLVAAVAAAVIGGLGSLWGPLLGGAVFGLTTQIMSFEVGALWGEVVGLVLVLAILIWRPRGLLAKRSVVKV